MYDWSEWTRFEGFDFAVLPKCAGVRLIRCKTNDDIEKEGILAISATKNLHHYIKGFWDNVQSRNPAKVEKAAASKHYMMEDGYTKWPLGLLEFQYIALDNKKDAKELKKVLLEEYYKESSKLPPLVKRGKNF